MMYMFGHDQTNSHRVVNKSFRVEEWWSYINTLLVDDGALPEIYSLPDYWKLGGIR